MTALHGSSLALLEVGRWLQRVGYRFVTVTPETHRRIDARAQRLGTPHAENLRDVFGWNRPFRRDLLPHALYDALAAADALGREGDWLRSRIRFSSLRESLFVHSAFPTLASDAVFFGPDSYRFCSLLRQWLRPTRRLIDIGCGSGVGGLSVADQAEAIVLSDINARALEYARVNAALNATHAAVIASDLLDQIDGAVHTVIANPPYMRDASGRTYRDGGGAFGEGLAVRIVRQALTRLSDGGQLIVYTGSAIVDGVDTFLDAILPALHQRDGTYQYEELDPDVFGDELDQPLYERVERIAAVGLNVQLA